MLPFELLDESLDLNKTEHYHLSIQASLDGFIFAISEPTTSRYLGIKGYQFEEAGNPASQYERIAQIISKDPFLQRSYLGVSCIQNESRSTLLPAALFERERVKLFFEFNHVLHDLDELHFNFLNKIDAYIIFPVHTDISNLYFKHWENARFFHQATPLIDASLSFGHNSEMIAGINFNKNHFDIVVCGDRKLKFYNNYSFRSEEDLLYFLLFVCDKMELDPEKTPFLLSGEIDKFSKLPVHLSRYLKNLTFQTVSTIFQYPPSFHKLQEHSLMNLLRIYHCG